MIIKKGTKFKIGENVYTADRDIESHGAYIDDRPFRRIECITYGGQLVPVELIKVINNENQD